MGDFLARVVVGFFVSIPITCLVAGGVQDGLALLLISIVCTAGIGLVAWIPLWWAVGWVTLKFLGRSTSERHAGEADNHWPPTHHQALLAYIRKARAIGMDQEEMMRHLESNGWERAEIQRALTTCDEIHSPQPEA